MIHNIIKRATSGDSGFKPFMLNIPLMKNILQFWCILLQNEFAKVNTVYCIITGRQENNVMQLKLPLVMLSCGDWPIECCR